MRLPSFIAGVVLSVGAAHADNAQLLDELVRTSPELAAAKSQAEAARADLWSARGQRLPQLRLEARAGTLEETLRVNGVPGELTGTRDPAAASAVVDQAIFTSGRIGGAIGAAKASAEQAAHEYDAARQDVLLEGAAAIADLVRDRAILDERRVNEEIVRGRLEESQARQRAGLATVTDIRQSEARFALAQAERIAAEGNLERSEAQFVRVFGINPPESLDLPRAPRTMPDNLEEALSAAYTANPDLAASEDGQRAARQAVRAERGRLLPQVTLNASASYIENERFGVELGEAEQYALTLQGRWDLFRGGSGYAGTRAAKKRADAARDLARLSRRVTREQVITAWTGMVSGRSAVRAREAQADAARIAAEGVAAEFRSGRRTRLDVLDADRERTDADVALVSARSDLAVAEFQLLRAMGAL